MVDDLLLSLRLPYGSTQYLDVNFIYDSEANHLNKLKNDNPMQIFQLAKSN
jgi:hypothetical protein